MRSLNSHIKINKLLDYSKEIRSKDNKLPKVIIIFDDKLFNKNAYSFIASDFLNEIAPSIKKLLNNLDKDPFMYRRQIFALLTLEIWKKTFDKD